MRRGPTRPTSVIFGGTGTISGHSFRRRISSKQFLVTIPKFPFQSGASLNAAGINYQSLKAAEALKRLENIESLGRPGN